MKSLYDLSWKVTEDIYRNDLAYSYSTLSRFLRDGFNKLDSLFDKVESPSLTFGSAVDALITGGQEEFNNNFIIADFPDIPDSVIAVIKECFTLFGMQYRNLVDIPDKDIIQVTEELKYQLNWKPETRAKVIKEKGREYYNVLYAATGKTILSNETGNQVMAAVRALKEAPATSNLFAENNPFDSFERFYQLKFKTEFEGITYRCMADLLMVDHEYKIVYPIDLKTSGHPEWEFADSFIAWNYQIQARLYWRIIRKVMDEDPDWREYKLADYTFAVVNKTTLTPLTWVFENTQQTGVLTYGRNNQIEMRDPFDIAKELDYYLTHERKVPLKISYDQANSLNCKLQEK